MEIKQGGEGGYGKTMKTVLAIVCTAHERPTSSSLTKRKKTEFKDEEKGQLPGTKAGQETGGGKKD